MIEPSTLRVLSSFSGRPPAAAEGVRNGDLLYVRVERKVSANRYVLSIGARRLLVRVSGDVHVGRTLRVRATWSGSTLFLVRESPAQSARRAANDLGVGLDVRSRAAITALLRSGMPATPEHVRTLARILERRGRSDDFYARLLAILLDKRIEPTDEFLDALDRLFTESGARHGREKGGARRRSGRRAHEEPFDGRPEKTAPETQFARDLMLQSRPTDAEHHALQLFNHLGGEHEEWQVVPYCVERADWRAWGTVRIRRSRQGRLRGFVLEVNAGDRAFRFPVRYDGSRGVASVPATDGITDSAAVRELTEKLRNVGIEVDDTIIGDAFDGFSTEPPFEPGALDTFV